MISPVLTIAYPDYRTTRTYPDRMVVRVYGGALADWKREKMIGSVDEATEAEAVVEMKWLNDIFEEVLGADFDGYTGRARQANKVPAEHGIRGDKYHV